MIGESLYYTINDNELVRNSRLWRKLGIQSFEAEYDSFTRYSRTPLKQAAVACQEGGPSKIRTRKPKSCNRRLHGLRLRCRINSYSRLLEPPDAESLQNLDLVSPRTIERHRGRDRVVVQIPMHQLYSLKSAPFCHASLPFITSAPEPQPNEPTPIHHVRRNLSVQKEADTKQTPPSASATAPGPTFPYISMSSLGLRLLRGAQGHSGWRCGEIYGLRL